MSATPYLYDRQIKCARRSCKWRGTWGDTDVVLKFDGFETKKSVCPKCGSDAFYEIKERGAKGGKR